MDISGLVFFAGVLLTLTIEMALIAVLSLKKELLIDEKGREALKRNSKTALYIVGLLLVSLFFQIIAEADELIRMEMQVSSEIFRIAATIHIAFLLLVLLLIARLTYTMGWGK